MPTTNELDAIGRFAAAVRAHLTGLSAEQVEDLTDDLEADLADAIADAPAPADGSTVVLDLEVRFGSPAAYAAELRTAAGLVPAPGASRLSGWRGVARAAWWRRVGRGAGVPLRSITTGGRQVLVRLRSTTWWSPVEDLLVSLRPGWWLVRAWVAFQVVVRVMSPSRDYRLSWAPHRADEVALLVVLVVLSAQWGRGRWHGRRWARGLGALASAAAVVLLVPMVVTAQEHASRVDVRYVAQDPIVYENSAVPDGVVVGGMQVSNLFVYDAAGNPLEDVQIYDDRGRPVRTTFDDGGSGWNLPGVDEPWAFVGARDADGRTRWNVYPLHGAPAGAFTWDESGQRQVASASTLRTPPLPFAKAPAIVGTSTTSASASTSASAVDVPPSATGADPDVSASPGPTSAGTPSATP